MKNRLEELDSLRGMAALTVVIGHFIGVYAIMETNTLALGMSSWVNWLKYTPLHIIYAGHEAVILFFILSGFVLTLPFLKVGKVQLLPFFIKRIVRIYVPVLVMLILALLLKTLFYREGGLVGLSSWINSKWSDPLTPQSLFEHTTLIFQHTYEFGLNPVLWSLTHEVRIYFLLPFLIPLLLKINWRFNLILCMILGILGSGLDRVITMVNLYGLDETMRYIPAFILGIMLAQHKNTIVVLYEKFINRKREIGLILLAILFYTFSWLLPNIRVIHIGVFNEGVIMIGASLFIIIGLNSKKVSSALKTPVLIFLGNISYSLYLYHLVILLPLLYIFEGVLPTWSILITAFALSILVSYLSYRYIETPSNNFARNIAYNIESVNKIKVSKTKFS